MRWGCPLADGSSRMRRYSALAPRKAEIHTGVTRLHERSAHRRRVVLVVPETDQALVTEHEARIAIEVDVGHVRDVEPEVFGQRDQRELVVEEVGRALVEVVRTVEADDLGPADTLEARAHVEAAAAPRVVGLPRRHRVEDHQRGRRVVVAHRQRDVVAAAIARAEHEQVVAGRPVRADGDTVKEGCAPGTRTRTPATHCDRLSASSRLWRSA